MSTNNSEFIRVNKAFDEARVFFMKYAIKPLPVDPYGRQQWTMASLHLVVVESFQNAYKRADTISPDEEQSFTKYCLFAHEFLDHHHWFEETIGFPALAPEFQCDAISEHAAFGEGMDRWQAYLASILGLVKNDEGKLIPNPNVTKAPYNAQKMRKCIEDMSTPLLIHLRHEIDWLDPEKLRACGLPQSKLEAVEAASQRHFAREVDHFSQSYFTFAHIPPDCPFPPAPWFVKKIVVPWVFYWKHRDAWRFVPAFY